MPRRAPSRLERRFRRRRRIRSGGVQLVYIVVGLLLGIGLPEVGLGPDVPAAHVKDMLFSIAAGVVAFIGIVYSSLFLVVQFSTNTFTARLNLFRDSPIVAHAFAMFVGLVVFCIAAAFTIGNDENTSAASPALAVLSLLAALFLFRGLQGAAYRSLQLAAVLQQVLDHGMDTLQSIYQRDNPEGFGQEPASGGGSPGYAEGPLQQVYWPYRAATLQIMDLPRLVRLSRREDATVELHIQTGDTLFDHDLVASIYGASSDVAKEVLDSLGTGTERTFEQDPRLAFRVVSDIALRALSPAVNDPTTAAQALDAAEAMLRYLVATHLDVGRIVGASGRVRVVVPLPTWEEYLSQAIDEVIDAASSSQQVRARLRRLLAALLPLAPEARRPAIEERQARPHAAVPIA